MIILIIIGQLKNEKKFLSTFSKQDRWYIFFRIFGQLSCRIGEIRGLMNKHVNVSSGIIRIEQQAQTGAARGTTIITVPKTKSSIRFIAISEDAMHELNEYMKVYKCKNPERFLFFDRLTPIRLNIVRRKFNEHIKMAKLKQITLHGIRHSNCTWLLSGVLTVQEIAQVSRKLSHSFTKMTLDIICTFTKKKVK